MANNMREVIAAIEAKIGPLSLFLTLGTEDSPTAMLTLVVSAVMLDHAAPQAAVKLIIDCVKAVGSDEVQTSIARVAVRPTTDGLVQAINSSIHVVDGSVTIQNSSFNGVYIAHGTVYKSVGLNQPVGP